MGEILMYNNGIHVDANVILKFVDDTLMPRCLVWIESSMRFCGVFLFSFGYLGYLWELYTYIHVQAHQNNSFNTERLPCKLVISCEKL